MKQTQWLAMLAASLLIGGCSSDPDPEPEPGEDTELADTGVDVEPDTTVAPDTIDETDTTEPDVIEDTDTGSTCESDWEVIAHTEPSTLSSPQGVDPMEPIAAGTASGGEVRSGERLFEGPYADCRVGDFVLTNEHIRVCIANERPISHLLYTGGQVIDMEPVDSPGGDSLVAITASAELLTASGDVVELISDGSDGGPAVVQVTGIDVPARAIANVVGNLLPLKNLEFVTEYRLAPGATALEAVTWVRGAGNVRRASILSDLVLAGDNAIPYWENIGFVAPGSTEFSLFGLFAPSRSYGVQAPSMHNISLDLGGYDVPLTGLRMTSGAICPDDEATYRRYYVVGDGTLPSLHEALADVATYSDISQSFNLTGMSGVEAPRFAVNDAEGNTVSLIQLGVDGASDAMVPEGDFDLVPIDWAGDAISVTFPSDGAIEIPAPPLGQLNITVTEGDAPLSARVDISGPITKTYFAMNGTAHLFLPPGSYTIHITRGERYSVEELTAEVVLGEEATLDAALTETMNTDGWISGDMHQHATPSVDSTIQLVDRAAANITTGLDFLAPTDHDSLGNYRDALDAIDGADEIMLFQGIETSPIYGHFNMFPFEFDRELPAHGAPPLSVREDGGLGRTVAMVPFLDLVAADIDAGARILQCNHPRGTQGLFNYAGFDPISGPDNTIEDKWYDDFSSVEIFNSIGEICQVARDWFSLTSRGYRITGMGNSDTHTLSSASGYPRDYLYVGDDGVTADAIVDAIDNMRVSVSGGLFISYADYLPGETIPVDAGETFTLHTTVQSPTYTVGDELVVFVNGVETQRIALESSAEDLVDYDDVLSFDLTEDSYIVLFAWSATRATLDHRGLPVSFINPIFIDIDGDGWTPPGVTDETGDHFIPEVTGFSFCD